jgi:hypothetical protein
MNDLIAVPVPSPHSARFSEEFEAALKQRTAEAVRKFLIEEAKRQQAEEENQ